MSAESEIQDVIEAVGDVADFLERHSGKGAEAALARVRKDSRRLAGGDLDALKSLLAETTGGMGSLNDLGLTRSDRLAMSDDEWRVLNRRRDALMDMAAEKCRIAMRRHGLEVWR